MRRLTKRAWVAAGGLQNPRLFRRKRGAGWTYWEAL